MKVKVYNEKKEAVREVELSDKIFSVAPNYDLLHQVIRVLQTSSRKPLAHAKDRGEVSGGGRKPWRQKGTGRARHGSIRSPLWSKGGVSHGPTKERNYSLKLNKKMKEKALKMILSLKAEQGLLQVLAKEVKQDFSKTKTVANVFAVFLRRGKKISRGLFVNDFSDKNKTLGFRNLKYLRWLPVKNLNVLDLVNFRYLILTEDALRQVQENLSGK